MLFWVIAGLLAFAVGATMVLASLRRTAVEDDTAASDIKVYRDQLSEVERDLKRGVIGPEEAERARLEISRRLLAADAALSRAQARSQNSGQRWVESRLPWAISLVIVIGGTLGLYSYLGQPNYADQPLEERLERARDIASLRPSQSAYEEQLPARAAPELDEDLSSLVNQLRDVVKERPNDLHGHELLARNEASLGNYTRAYQAQTRIIELKADEATAGDYLSLADYYMFAAEGYISPEAEAALSQSLRLDPRNGYARYYTGVLMMQTGRPDLTFRFWRQLLEEGPESAPWIPPIRANIEDLAWIAGVPYQQPEVRGPTAEDIAAADSLSAGDRAAMIEGMVQSLSERLATEGGTAQEWAQLITALGVLGRRGDAGDIWREAQDIFGDHASDLELINQAAEAAGLDQE